MFFKPYYFMGLSDGKNYRAVVKNGQLYWNIKGNQISYNQVKKAIQ